MHQIVDLWQSDSCLRGKGVQSPQGFLRPQSTPEHFNPSPLWLYTLVYILGSDSGWSAQQWCKRAWFQLHSGFCFVKKNVIPSGFRKRCRTTGPNMNPHWFLYFSALSQASCGTWTLFWPASWGSTWKKVSFFNLYICWIWVNSTGA